MTHETEACTCPSLCGDLCHLGEGCRAMEHVRRHSEPPNFCARCGKRLTPEGAHTCTPPMSRDAELEQARAEEREACAKVCESERDALNENLQVWQENPTLTPCDEFVADWDSEAKIGEQYAAAIRARGQK